MNVSHYAEGRKYEPIKVIEDWNLNFNLGSALKYISRCGRKGNHLSAISDLNKAIDYLKFEIACMQGEVEKQYPSTAYGTTNYSTYISKKGVNHEETSLH